MGCTTKAPFREMISMARNMRIKPYAQVELREEMDSLPLHHSINILL